MITIQTRQYLSVITSSGADIHCSVTYQPSSFGRGHTQNKLTAITAAVATPGTAILGKFHDATSPASPDSAQVSFEVSNAIIRNVDATAQTVTICIVEENDAGTQTVYELYEETIEAGQELIYEAGSAGGWTLQTHSSVSLVQSVSAPGTISPAADYVLLTVDGTDAFTLDDGALGHQITIECIAATSTPIGTVTFNGAQAAYGTEATTVVFTSAGQMVTLVMTSTGWKRVSFSGAETVASGALNLHWTTSYLSVTNTVAYTLADGIRIGQRKRVQCSAVSGTPLGTLTINDAAGTEPTSWVFTAVDQAISLEWTSGGWKLLDVTQAGTEIVAASGTAKPLCLIHRIDVNAADFIQPDAVFAGQRSIWFASAATGAASTVSGLFWDEDGSADGVDANFSAIGDMAAFEWVSTRWLMTSNVSVDITT